MKALRFLLLLNLAGGCGAPETPRHPRPRPEASTSVSPRASARPEVPAPELRLGALPARLQATTPLRLEAHSYYRGAGFEVVGLGLPVQDREARNISWVRLSGGGIGRASTGPLFAQRGEYEGPSLWAFVPTGNARDLSGTLISTDPPGSGTLATFRTEGALPRRDRAALTRWAEAVADHYHSVSTSYHQFAASRLRAAFGSARDRDPSFENAENRRLLEQAAAAEGDHRELQRRMFHHATALTDALARRPTHSVDLLKPAERLRLPFETWITENSLVAPDEPLAGRTPRDFYFVRARTPLLLSAVADDEGVGSASRVFGLSEPLALDTTAGYLEELGLSRETLIELSAGIVGEVALIGSDTDFARGTDVSLLFQVHDERRFDAVLDAALRAYGSPAQSQWQPEDSAVAVTETQIAARRVRQQRARADGVALVSNSRAATARVLSAWAKRDDALLGDPGFRYFAGRNPKAPPSLDEAQTDVLVFAGDAFLDANGSPERAVQRMRRAVAELELQTPLFASLLYRTLLGRTPETVRELTGLGLLKRGELRHFDASRIDFDMERGTSSSWGRNHRSTPLIDLPDVTKVNTAERDTYARVREQREIGAASVRGPFYSRLNLSMQGDQVRGVHFLARSAPVPPEYAAYASATDSTLLSVQPLASGARIVAALSPDRIPRALVAALSEALGRDVELGWLGDAVALGIDDDFTLAHEVKNALGAPEVPPDDAPPERSVKDLLATLRMPPVYAVLRIRTDDDASPDAGFPRLMLKGGFAPRREKWDELGEVTHWSPPTSRCGARGCEVKLYSAQRGEFLFVSSNRSTLEALLRQGPPDHWMNPGSATPRGHFFYQVQGRDQGAIETVLHWLFESNRRKVVAPSRELAAVLFGAVEEARSSGNYIAESKHYLGLVPTTSEGNPFKWVEDGLEDPLRGTRASPAWRSLPIDERSAELTRLVSRLDLAVRFTREGSLESSPVHGVIFRGSIGEAAGARTTSSGKR